MRVLISPDNFVYAGDGTYNMALDKVLFETNDSLGLPSLRFYCFGNSTITIPIRYSGSDLCPQKILHDNVKLSRRISGGKYLLHQLGLTYALFIPKNHSSINGLNLRESYRRLSQPIPKALQKLNKSVDFLQCTVGVKKNTDCAMETEVESMGIQGVKFVGAAQKRGRYCLIQHGEIQLFSSPLGLGHYLRDGIAKETVGLDARIIPTNFKTFEKLVCQASPSEGDNNGSLCSLRENVASEILFEFEKVLGERHYHQLESSLINRAIECRKEFEIVLK